MVSISSREINFVVTGVLLGQVLFLLIDSLFSYSSSDKINVIGIVVNVLIGAIIAIMIQKKLSDDRGVKDYFIRDLEDITSEYKKFRNGLYGDQCTARFMIEWFKNTSMKLNHLEEFLESDLSIKTAELQTYNRKIHQIITNSEPFSVAFKSNDKVVLSNKLRREISEEMEKLKHNIIRTIIAINRA